MMIHRYFHILRPTQWLKNLMILFPPFLGGTILQPGIMGKSFAPILSFCMVSSGIYIINDILDAENDAVHPVKKARPIPSGQIGKKEAFLVSLLLLIAGLALGASLSRAFLAMVGLYVIISTSYSLKLKELPLIDIFCISAGFILRLEAGGFAFGITISEWLFLSVFLLSIFLSTGKRLYERTVLGDTAGCHRRSLMVYPDGFLDGILFLTGAVVLVTYTMYTLPHKSLIYSVPLCTFGLFRYILRVKSGLGGDPTESLLKDVQLFVVGILWVGMVGWSIYH